MTLQRLDLALELHRLVLGGKQAVLQFRLLALGHAKFVAKLFLLGDERRLHLGQLVVLQRRFEKLVARLGFRLLQLGELVRQVHAGLVVALLLGGLPLERCDELDDLGPSIGIFGRQPVDLAARAIELGSEFLAGLPALLELYAQFAVAIVGGGQRNELAGQLALRDLHGPLEISQLALQVVAFALHLVGNRDVRLELLEERLHRGKCQPREETVSEKA